jgi:hypothetical protein
MATSLGEQQLFEVEDLRKRFVEVVQQCPPALILL